MNEFDTSNDIELHQETERCSKLSNNILGSVLLVVCTIAFSLMSFMLVKDEYGPALGLLAPMAITLGVIAVVIYCKEIH